MNINILLLEKRGTNYLTGDFIANLSDVKNHRVYTEFTDKNGVRVYGDLSHGITRDYTKKTKPIRKQNAIYTDFEYYNNKHECYSYNNSSSISFDYTINGILNFINSISNVEYKAIKFVKMITFEQLQGANFTPSYKIIEFAKQNRIDYQNTLDGVILNYYSGSYKYYCYKIESIPGTDKERVTIYLEEV